MTKAGEKNVLNARGVREHFDISKSTLYRWMNDDSLAFPKPYITVRKRHYWKEHELVRWQKSRAAAPMPSLDDFEVLTGAISEYNELVDALRNRRNQLKLPVLEVDARSGMQEGYTSKLENYGKGKGYGKGYSRGAGPESLPRWLRGLGVAIVRHCMKASAPAAAPITGVANAWSIWIHKGTSLIFNFRFLSRY